MLTSELRQMVLLRLQARERVCCWPRACEVGAMPARWQIQIVSVVVAEAAAWGRTDETSQARLGVVDDLVRQVCATGYQDQTPHTVGRARQMALTWKVPNGPGASYGSRSRDC